MIPAIRVSPSSPFRECGGSVEAAEDRETADDDALYSVIRSI
jgi:hypothetical protein